MRDSLREIQKPLPMLTSDEAAERFVDEADLSEFNLSGMALNTFEFALKVEIDGNKVR